MKRILVLFIYLFSFSLIAYSQWEDHYYFDISVTPPWTSTFADAIFTTSDTGYYCYTVLAPSPSSPNEVFVNKTTNDCSSWATDYTNSNMGVSSYALKYFKPFIYYLWNYQGILSINRKQEGDAWQALPATAGYYRDFFAHDSSNYKVLYLDASNNVIQRYFENNIEIRTDTFLINKPNKIFYPIDTVGVLLSLSSPSTGYNTVILKYTSSSGYNLVYQDQNQKLSDVYFPSVNFGYVAGDSGLVLRSSDLGDTWSILNTGFDLKLNSVFFTNDSTGYVVGDSGLILRTSNYGLSWQQQTSPNNISLNKIFFVNDTVGFILSGQTLIKTTNGGITWINQLSSGENTLKIFPNPTKNESNIIIPPDFRLEKYLTLTIYDHSGRVNQKHHNAQNVIKTHVSFINEPKGLYYVILNSETKFCSGKIIVY